MSFSLFLFDISVTENIKLFLSSLRARSRSVLLITIALAIEKGSKLHFTNRRKSNTIKNLLYITKNYANYCNYIALGFLR